MVRPFLIPGCDIPTIDIFLFTRIMKMIFNFIN